MSIQKTLTISKKHQEVLEENHVSPSRFMRNKIEEEWPEEFEDEE